MGIATRISIRRFLSGAAIVLAFSGLSFAAQGKSLATVSIAPTPEQYAVQPPQLTAGQCAQCHTAPFQGLKESGGKHQFACQSCHNVFHAYSPRKNNYDTIMPKCGSCHAAPHGAKVGDCISCHSNPHTPRKIAASAQIITFCYDCHGAVRKQLDTFPSKHTKVACATCHTSHGFKPSCFTCHTKPHLAGQTVAQCLQCHPVHQPRSIVIPEKTPTHVCSSCHGAIVTKLTKGTSKHATLTCVTCHKGKHRTIPQCTDCHGKPHKASFHEKVPRCLNCHVDVHDLPVMK